MGAMLEDIPLVLSFDTCKKNKKCPEVLADIFLLYMNLIRAFCTVDHE